MARRDSLMDRHLVAFLASVFICVSFCLQAHAANIVVDHSGSRPIISVDGELGTEDGQKFSEKISGLTGGIVAFNSPGGLVIAGLRMGTLINLHNFDTVVGNGYRCASACAIAWLGGTTRYMAPKAFIGFHAAYLIEHGQQIEKGAPNALVGAYLNSLGLSFDAIVYLTSTPPQDITWLTPNDARTHGITVAVWPPAGGIQSPSALAVRPDRSPERPQSKTPAPLQPNVKLDEVARAFANTYFAHWSETNSDALRYFGGVYAESITFFDRPVQRSALLEEKRKFAERWPERIYTARPPSIKTNCSSETSKCTITGQVEWDCRNPSENQRSVGVANFTLQIVVSQIGGVTVAGEWSTVVARLK